MITIQAYAIAAYLLLSISYWFKNKIITLALQIGAYLFFAYHYFLLGANSGAISNLVGVLILIIIFLNSKDWLSKNGVYILSIIILLGNAFYSFDNFYSLFSIFGISCGTLGMISNNIDINKISGIITGICWLIYGSIVGSYVTFFAEIFFVFFTILALISSKKRKNI